MLISRCGSSCPAQVCFLLHKRGVVFPSIAVPHLFLNLLLPLWTSTWESLTCVLGIGVWILGQRNREEAVSTQLSIPSKHLAQGSTTWWVGQRRVVGVGMEKIFQEGCWAVRSGNWFALPPSSACLLETSFSILSDFPHTLSRVLVAETRALYSVPIVFALSGW